MPIIKEYLIRLISDKLDIKVEDIEIDMPFFAMGISSIISEEIFKELSEYFKNLNSTILFEYPNINQLSEYLEKGELKEGTSLFEDIEGNNIVEEFVEKSITNYTTKEKYEDEIAVIGISCKVPKAETMDEFWENLINNVDCIEEIPKERWDYKKYYNDDKEKSNITYSKWGGFIKDVDKFDPLFFNISPKEAEIMDPQEKLFLTVCWESMEDAGYGCKGSRKNNRVGVYSGVTWNEFSIITNEESLAENKFYGAGSLYWKIPNRVSYFMDLKGPSMALDSACSSSLSALHEACHGIITGDCDMAIAGGVNLNLHPAKYIFLSEGRFLSSDGRCKSFSEDGNGYVPGEGVVAVVLKRLSQAKKDGDNIYGIVKGTSVNHGGKAAGYTVPNPNAQGDLILKAIERSNISAEEISYIECHGTGTSLGDPIEIQGLKNAFDKYTNKKQICTIGSVKSNIGHLEAAAGLIGLIKVLLMMKNNIIPANLFSDNINKRIDLKATPFKLAKENILLEKKSYKGTSICAVSSFGAGGSNAHVIVESYEDNAKEIDLSNKEQQVIFSAMSKEQVIEYAIKLKEKIEIVLNKEEKKIYSVHNISRTLRNGRELFKYVAIVEAKDIDELKEKLEIIISDGTTSNNIFEKNKIVNSIKEFNNDYHKLSLPTYPFLREKSWINKYNALYEEKKVKERLHPMIQENLSDFAEQKYKVIFNGEEFFLRDHLVEKEKVLPGVAYIEMARAAGELAIKEKITEIKNIVFLRPIKIKDAEEEVVIELFLNEEKIDFEIRHLEEKWQICCQGELYFKQSKELEEDTYDVKSMQKNYRKYKNSEDVYKYLHSIELNLGESFKSIKEIYYDEKQGIGILELPKHLEEDFNKFVLHPSLMDGALQVPPAAEQRGEENYINLPFTIRSVRIVRPLQKKSYAYTSLSYKNNDTRKFDVKILNDKGEVLVEIDEFWARPIEEKKNRFEMLYYVPSITEKNIEHVDLEETSNTIMVFDGDDILTNEIKEKLQAEDHNNIPILSVKFGTAFNKINKYNYEINIESIEDYKKLIESVEEDRININNIIYNLDNLVSTIAKTEKQIKKIVSVILYTIKAWSKRSELKLYSIYQENDDIKNVIFASMSGMSETIHLESKKITFKSISIDSSNENRKAQIILNEVSNIEDKYNQVYYNSEKRLVKKFQNIKLNSDDKTKVIKENGVYIITGGAGGLGLIFADYIATYYKTNLILVGRSELTEEKRKRIDEIRKKGSNVDYFVCDVCREEKVKELYDYCKNKFNAVNGIIHTAGIIEDSLIINKKISEFENVISPKVFGTINLDKVFKNENLDFIMLFSSLTVIIGNVGQIDYSYGNAFMDEFLSYRKALVEKGERKGRILSINWPLWKNGGMNVDESSIEFLENTMGFKAIDKKVGIEAFEKALENSYGQLVVVEGNKNKIDEILNKSIQEKSNIIIKDNNEIIEEDSNYIENETLKQTVIKDVKQIISDMTSISEGRLDIENNLSDYGYDSVGLIKLSNAVNKKYGIDVTPAIFFEYPSINDFVNYLLEEYEKSLNEIIEKSNNKKSSDSDQKTQKSISNNIVKKDRIKNNIITPIKEKKYDDKNQKEDIAIIGAYGVMPKAKELSQYWENLINNRDCITEIPEDRWNWRDYYGDVFEDINKTNIKWGGFIEDVDKFDAKFFGISPREAELMDPQQRIMLETVWRTVEDSGYKISELSKEKVGVFIGASTNDYFDLQCRNDVDVHAFTTTGNFHSILANRINYIFNFTGPSVPVDTACSSSLVAIRAAIESIWTGGCEVAIAGGINLMLSPTIFISFSKARMLSETGKCKTFDKDANGYVRGEGAGTVLLKPLSKAIKDKDHIYAVIKGSSINHGGKVNTLTAPNPNAQADLIKSAFKEAGVDPSTVSYMEAHGTGTSLGDPIEINGLKKAFKDMAKENNSKLSNYYCGVGSVKTNIGHLEAGAGISALLKVILAMKHKQIPASINFKELNPYIKLENTPFYLITENTKWNRLKDKNGNEIPRRAGISSFGFGGVNSHVFLEEYMENRNINDSSNNEKNIFVLSAKEKDILINYSNEFVKYLKSKIKKQVNSEEIFSKTINIIREIAIDIFEINVKDLVNEDNLDDYIDDRILKYKFIESIGFKLNVDVNFLKDDNDLSINHIAEILVKYFKDKLSSYVDLEVEYNEDLKFNDIAYTLQTGREEMECRLAIVVNSIDDLAEKLESFVEGKIANGVYSGNIMETSTLAPILEGEEAKYLIEKLFDNNNLEKVAQLWTIGAKLNWQQLYKNQVPQKISLPTYPFNEESYWIPVRKKEKTKNSVLCNIIEKKSFDNSKIFSKVLNINDEIIFEHKIGRKYVLPGVAYASIIMECVKRFDNSSNYNIENISWTKSVPLDEQLKEIQIFVKLYLVNNNYEFNVFTKNNDEEEIYCTGSLIFTEGISKEYNKLNEIKTLKNNCQQKIVKDNIYKYFETIDFHLGNYFKTIKELYILDDKILSSIEMDNNHLNEVNDFKIHPTLMDAVFQSIGAKAGYIDDNKELLMPFSVDKIEFVSNMNEKGYLVIKKTNDIGEIYDAMVLKEDGSIAVKIFGIVMLKAKKKDKDIKLLKEKWIKSEVGINNKKLETSGVNIFIYESATKELVDSISIVFRDSIKINISEKDSKFIDEVIENCNEINSVYFIPKTSDIEALDKLEKYEKKTSFVLFNLIKSLISYGYSDKSIGLKIITFNNIRVFDKEKINPISSSIQGLARTVQNELIEWKVSLIDVDSNELVFPINILSNIEQGECAIREDSIYIRQMDGIKIEKQKDLVWRKNGVYIIVGGVGGIGLTLCKYIVSNTDSTVILFGRRSVEDLSDYVLRELEVLKKKNKRIEYIQTDITDFNSIDYAIKEVKEKYDEINGVVHSAIVLKDQSLINMSWESFQDAMKPKLTGSINLYQSVKREKLDFMLFLSSIQSYVGNRGQSNYGAASTFEDAFAKYLNTISDFDVKLINWGYWGSVGIVANERYNEMLGRQGLYSIEPKEGINVINKLLANNVDQIIAVKASENYLEKLNSNEIKLLEKVGLHQEKVILEPVLRKINDLAEIILIKEFQNYSYSLIEDREYTFNEFMEKLNISLRYSKLFDSVIEILSKRNVIKKSKEKIYVNYDMKIHNDYIKAYIKDFMNEYPEYIGYIKFLLICTKSFYKVISEKMEAVTAIFPNGSIELVKGIYSNNPIANQLNQKIAFNLEKEIKALLKIQPKVRILEIGAGTGSTCEMILPHIEKYKENIQYDFTDISQGFLKYGEEKFKEKYTFVNFKVLNIEKTAKENNFNKESYDVIIASNVLHATKNIDKTIKNVNRLLKNKGKLFLNELTSSRSFYTITFGLLDGWWLFEDEEKRIRKSPLLNYNNWECVLNGNGFISNIIENQDEIGQHVIKAIKVGNV